MARLAHPLFGELRRAAAARCTCPRCGAIGHAAGRTGGRRSPDDGAPRVADARVRPGAGPRAVPRRGPAHDEAAGSGPRRPVRHCRRGSGFGAESSFRRSTGSGRAGREGRGASAQARRARRGRRHRWATLRAANLIWMLGRPAEAADILAELAQGRKPMPSAQRGWPWRRASMWCSPDAPRPSKRQGPHWNPGRCPTSRDAGVGGAGDGVRRAWTCRDITPVARAALDRARNSYETSHMRFWFGGVYARACRLTGRIEECHDAAAVLAALANECRGWRTPTWCS